jgi:putative oxidoreductase
MACRTKQSAGLCGSIQRIYFNKGRGHNVKRLARLDCGWGIAVFRMIMGFVLIITGYEKLISGVEKVSATMLKNRISFPTAMAVYITALELLGGFLLLVGLGGRWLGLLYIGEFVVVTFYILVPTRGWMDARLPIMLLAGALMLFVSGSGKASLDGALRNLRQKRRKSGDRVPVSLQHMEFPDTRIKDPRSSRKQ